ncbi:hypothetical protein OB03_03680 [Brevundimonas sp. GN22]
MDIRAGVAAMVSVVALLTGCATLPPIERGGAPSASASVIRQGDTLHLQYQLDRDADVWAFFDSALMSEVREPWRPRQWQVLTPGVVLDRVGFYDILRSVDGGPVPRTVDIRITPKAVDLEAEYPTLKFSNGAVALPTRQMTVFPMESVAAVAALPSDLNGVDLATGPTQVRWRDEAGPVLYAGERRPELITQYERSYVLLGQADVTRDEGLTAVIDPALPHWMANTLADAAPATGRWYRQRLGAASSGAEKPVLMAAWNGPTQRMTSMGGSVLPGLIVMSFEGRGIEEPNPEIRERALWFIAHEAAHFWLGQTLRYEYARDAWITEGGADLMAVRALKARDPSYDDKSELQTEIDDCVKYAARPLGSAGERGEHRAYYACGAVFAMAAETAERRKSGGDFLDFVRLLLSENRRDGVVTVQDWMSLYARRGGRPEQASLMLEMVNNGTRDPKAAVLALLEGWDVALEGDRVVLR